MLLTSVVYIAFAVLLIVVAVVDARTLRIPNEYILALSGLWLAWRVLLGLGGLMVGTDFITAALAPSPFKGVSFADGVIGAVFLGGGLLIATAAYEAISKKRAMGGGDIKLLAVIGLFLGLERGLLCLLVACVVSLIVSLVLPHVEREESSGERKVCGEYREGGEDGEGSGGEPELEPAVSVKPRVLRDLPFAPSLVIGSAIALLIV